MNAHQSIHSERGWDVEKIKGELRRKGFTLAQLDREYGYAPGHFSHALRQPLRKAEKIIGDILGVHPSKIWPTRYGADGRPHQGRFLPNREPLKKDANRQAKTRADQ